METNLTNTQNKKRKIQHKMNGRIQVLALVIVKIMMLWEMYLMPIHIVGKNKRIVI